MTEKQAQPIPPMIASPYEKLVKDHRVLFLNGEVRAENMGDLSAQMLLLSLQDPEKDITLIINSPGGSVTDGLVLYDTMQLVPNDIVTLGMGMCASMGQFLLTSGAPGKRFITPNTRVLLHQPLGGAGGVQSDIERQAQLINRMKVQLATITAKNTGKTVEQVMKDGDRDSWYEADEALEYGFVDHIVTSLHEVNSITAQLDAEKGK